MCTHIYIYMYYVCIYPYTHNYFQVLLGMHTGRRLQFLQAHALHQLHVHVKQRPGGRVEV